MRKAFQVSVLVAVMALSANAGDMPNGADPAPTPTPQTSNVAATDGDMPNGITTQVVLNVLESLLSLF